jgi:molecular chaperone DnaK
MQFIGIDIGAGYSCISIIPEGEEIPQLCRSPKMNFEIPSVVWYKDSGEVVVGDDSRDVMKKGTDVCRQIVKSPKKHIGTDRTWTVRVGGKDTSVTPEDAVSEIIRYLFGFAEVQRYMKRDPRHICVLSVPAFYNKASRQTVVSAAEKAGIGNVKIISKPVATALAYDRLSEESIESGGILVFQMGAYALDVTVLWKDADGKFTILYSAGCPDLGGYDWDTCIVNEMKRQYAEFTGMTLDEVEKDDSVCCAFRQEAGKIKKELSELRKFDDRLFAVDSNFYFALTRTRFEELTKGLLDRAMGYVADALEDIENIAETKGIRGFRIDKVLLEGGSCKMPMIREEILRRYPRFEGICESFDPEYAAAEGAAIFAKDLGESQPAIGDAGPLKE